MVGLQWKIALKCMVVGGIGDLCGTLQSLSSLKCLHS